MQIRKLAEYVGDQIGIEVEAVITDGSEPIGNGVGARFGSPRYYAGFAQ